MEIKGWRYYSRAAIPTTAPHEPVNTAPLTDGSIWKLTNGAGHTPMLVRWTEDFDCGCETNWWYVIKDTPFDIAELKAKRRYEINKGIKNFEIRQIVPQDCAEEICEVAFAAYEEYPAAYRPNVTREQFINDVSQWKYQKNYGAFDVETGRLCGYALLQQDGDHMDFTVMKAIPACEKKGVNAALVYGVLKDQQSFLESGGYICDGSRSINHETAFQDYLEKYFSFRKAYCRLHIRYKWWLAIAVKCLYPFRKRLAKINGVSAVYLVNSLLKMEGYSAKRDKCL